MKRKFTFMAGLAALAMLFVACSNLDEDAGTTVTPDSGNKNRNGSLMELTLSLTDQSFDIARNVYPGDWTNGSKADLAGDLANKLVWVLTGYTVQDERTVEEGSDSSHFTDPDTPSNEYIILDYQDLMNGTAQVKLKPLIWYFTLTAYGTLEADATAGAKDKTITIETGSDGKITNTEVCLVGTMHADMTGGENKITFNMLPPVYVKDTEGKYTITTDAIGTAKYAVSFTPPDSFWYMKYAFYPEDADTLDTPKYDTPANDAIKSAGAEAYFVKKLGADPSDSVTLVEAAYTPPASTGALPEVTAKTSDAKTYETAASGVDGYTLTYKMFDTETDGDKVVKTGITHYLKAGKYWFRAEFYDTNNKRLLMHTEKFVIDGINTSEDEVQLNYKTFSSAPQNIEELSLQYKYNDVSFDEDPVSLYAAHCARNSSAGAANDEKYPDAYTATLSWEDVADNEIGYQLWLRTWDGSAYTDEVFTPEDLTDATSTAKTTYKISTLAAGINTTSIELKTGVKYEIRLRAFNDRSQTKVVSGGTDQYGTVWGTYALAAKEAGYDYFVPYIPRKADYNDTDATSLEASDINFGLFTIDYNLNGGKIKQTSAKTSTKLHYTIPYIYKESVNKLIDTSEFPYIERAGYDFIGWNELYGNTGITIDGKIGTKWIIGGKPYYTHPNYGEATFDEKYKATIPATATVSLDSIVMNNSTALTKSETVKAGNTADATSGNNTPAEGSLATYTWTVTLDAESTEYAGHVVSEVSPAAGTKKYIYSNLLQAGSDIPETCENRELYASWETPLSMSIKLPAYPSFKLTKIAAAGDPIEYAISSDPAKNVLELKASDKLADLAFSIYYDDATNANASTVFDTAITSIDATGTGSSDSTAKTTTYTSTDTKATLVVPYTEGEGGAPVPGTGGTFTWNYNGKDAGVYILKVSGTYTYGESKTNSLEKQKDVVEGYIYIRLTN